MALTSHAAARRRRLYLMEVGYFAGMLDPTGEAVTFDWRGLLAQDLRRPRLRLGWFTSVRVRLRRNYLMLLYFVTAAWLTKLFIHPARPQSTGEFFTRLAVGDLFPSWLVALTALLFVGSATALAVTCPSGEEIENWSRVYLDGEPPAPCTAAREIGS